MRPPTNVFSSLLGPQIPPNIPRFPHRLITENSAAKSAQPRLPTGHQCKAAGCQPAPPASQVAPKPNCQVFQHPTAKPGPNSLANHPYPRISPRAVPKVKQTAASLEAGSPGSKPGSQVARHTAKRRGRHAPPSELRLSHRMRGRNSLCHPTKFPNRSHPPNHCPNS